MQEDVAFMHDPAEFTFLRKISGKNAKGRGMLRRSVNGRLVRASGDFSADSAGHGIAA
jgi:hypothetical protein